MLFACRFEFQLFDVIKRSRTEGTRILQPFFPIKCLSFVPSVHMQRRDYKSYQVRASTLVDYIRICVYVYVYVYNECVWCCEIHEAHFVRL